LTKRLFPDIFDCYIAG